MKNIIKLLLPPIILNFCRRLYKKKYGWFGHYQTFEEVEKLSLGYDIDEILQKVRNSLLKVKNKEVIYERDGVAFDKIYYSWPLLSGLLYAATQSKNSLNIIDFGGSLGSTYYQNRKFLKRLPKVSWNIVEQKNFVDIGKQEFEDGELKFFYDLKSAKSSNPNINILLLSSVIQYLKSPYQILDEILQYDFQYILIDRTVLTHNISKVTLQKVPPYIYKASYPCWFLNELEFKEYFAKKGYEIIEEFDALDGVGEDYNFKGFIMEKINV